MNRQIYSSQVLVTVNNFLLSLFGLIYLENDNFKVWFIASQTFFIAQTFLRSAYFEPAIFNKKSIKIDFSKSILIYIYFFATLCIVNKYSIDLSLTNINLISASLSMSILQDSYRYKKILISPEKVVVADAIVLASTLLLIAWTKAYDTVVFILILIALPNVISIMYLKLFTVKSNNQIQEYQVRSKPIYSVSSLLEITLNQLMAILITIYFSSLEMQSLRTLILVVSPLTSLRLFSWSTSILEGNKTKLTATQKKRKRENLLYILISISIFVLSYSFSLNFLHLPQKYVSIIFILTTLLALIFVEQAVIIRQRASKLVISYFAIAFPVVSISYLAAFRNESTLNQLVIFQFAITLLNSIFSIWYLRFRIREN